ncbi:CoA transferase [Gordonia terrae]|uniref:CoA transferase n=1 Tax=Gordonia terrae TaxID=2055 RepID=UPI00200ABC6E|nr:CoA transferase [Gordonia terrae]UPW08623.1 CoA transferase [Gordonia terrae]
MFNPLTDRLRNVAADPATDDTFDPFAELDDVLTSVGLSASAAGGSVTFGGADPVVPSTLRLGGAAAIALAAKSVAVGKLWRLRGGEPQDIAVDLRSAPRRLCPMYEKRWELLNGYAPGMSAIAGNGLSLTFHRSADDRWIMPVNLYPKLNVAAQRLLGTPDDHAAVAAAVARWKASDLEQAAEDAGVVLPMVRSLPEMLDELQYRDVLSTTDLIEIEKIGDSEPEPFASGVENPLDGVRALGMGHVIAGAGAGRALALHGADVLNLWRPNEVEHDATYYTANVGMRSATIDPYNAEGISSIRDLLRDADVFFANRRPGYLDQLGLGAAEAAALRPGIVHATVSLHGETGPWARRIGFDQVAGAVSGMMDLEGRDGTPSLPPIGVVNDYIVSWLLATGITEALMRRAADGGSYRVHVSLTRVALWVLALGVFDQDYARETAGTGEMHAYRPAETFTADTPLGRYQGVTDQVTMTRTPGRYRTVLVPRGASRPEWLNC